MSPFEAFLSQLAIVLEFKNLKPDNQGACQILMKKEQVFLLFEYDSIVVPHTVLLSSPLCQINESNQNILSQILKKNKNTEATFSLKEADHHIYLHRRLSCTISKEHLKSALNSFLQLIKNFQKDLLSQPAVSKKEEVLGTHFKV